MTISNTARFTAVSLGLFALGAGTTFIFSGSKPAEHSVADSPAHVVPSNLPERGFYENLQVVGDEAEGYPSLAAMADAADLVVVGTLSNFRLHRHIETGSADYVVHMGAADVTVKERVRGDDDDRLLLEFLLTGRAEDIPAKVEQERAKTHVDPVLLFLRETQPGTYRLVNSRGLWADVNGALTAPLVVRHPDSTPRPRGPYTATELAQAEFERAARPAHLRNKLPRALDPRPKPGVSPVAIEAAGENEAAPYASELNGVRSVAELAAKLRD